MDGTLPKFLCCSMYFLFWAVLCIVYVCKYVLYYCQRVATKLQIKNISYHIVHRIIYHILSYRIISYHIISYHIISYHISYHIISYHIISYHIVSYRIVSYHIVSYHIISYLISYHISYRIVSYISYHISYHLCTPQLSHDIQPDACYLCRRAHKYITVTNCMSITTERTSVVGLALNVLSVGP